MSNKAIGSEFEKEMAEILAKNGFWVHFIVPDARGAQPFDIIAVKDKKAFAIECKTLVFGRRYFSVERLEENQKMAFDRWMRCGNGNPIIAVKQTNDIVTFEYKDLINEDKKRIDMRQAIDRNNMIVVDGFGIYGIMKEMML